MKGLSLLFSAAAAVSMIGCESELDTPTQDSINEAGFFAKFNPSEGSIPFPNNLLFDGNSDGVKDTTYGKLEIPIPDPVTGTCDNSGEIALKTSLNDLDGFSTVAPISTSFSSAIDSNSLVVGDTVRVFEVTLSGVGGVVTSITGELTADDVAVSISTVDAATSDGCSSSSPGANKLVISPRKPLNPKSNYLVAITNSIKGADGNNAAADKVYAFAKSTTALVTSFPATSLGEVSYSALLSTADANNDGTIDAGETTAVLTSINGLEGLRQVTSFSENAIVNYTITADAGGTITDLAASDIILSWAFTTQSVDDVLTDLQGVVAGSSPASVLALVNPGNPLSAADLYAGTLTTNYYLNTAASVNDPSPLGGSWRGAGNTALTASALATTTNTTVDPATATAVAIPLLASFPKVPDTCSVMPGSGWPVVIFQHGITRNRTDMLTIADAMAAECFAVVAIDMPLHGLTGDEIDGTENFYDGTGTIKERTFDLDLVNNTTGASGPDLVTDTSGKHYINLLSLITTRDNVRQSVADLYSLRKALDTMNSGGNSFDPAEVYFVGHSLGGMVGSVFLATDSNVKSAVLAMPGGGIAKLLDGSAAFGPEISAGLGANGINKGTAQYEEFLASAQMFIDSADPLNYASNAGQLAGRGVLMFEVAGDGASNLPDQTIPNNVLGISGTVNAPLSGTDPLVATMGLTQQSTSTTGAPQLDIVVKFTAGHHGSILTANDADGNADASSAAVTVEMQAQMAEFIASDGGSITINTSVVQQ